LEKGYTGAKILEDMSFAHNYNKFIKKLRDKLISSKENKTVVDYGAGSGEFCLYRSDNIFYAVEPDKNLRQELKDKGISVIDFKKLKSSSVDFLYSINVLEHVENDELALYQIHKVLSKKGKVLIYVPAFQFLWTGLDDEVRHFRRYTKKSLEKKLEKCGFRISSLKYADSIGFFVVALHRILNKNVRLNKRNIILFDRILFPLSRILDLIIFDKFLGKNVYALAEKKDHNE
jgi:SAM-dependent methyltransferase